jgi:polyisoprenoid-binding protein YceI
MSVCSWNFVATQLTFNFANLAVSDLVDSWMNQKLVGHLNSADFFDTATFPTWLFVSKLLTKNTDWYTVVGDLTIKWITNEITFPIKVTTIWNEYKINWEISIDRTKRNIMYSSTKLIDTLKDKAIEDTIKTTFELTTSPAL